MARPQPITDRNRRSLFSCADPALPRPPVPFIPQNPKSALERPRTARNRQTSPEARRSPVVPCCPRRGMTCQSPCSATGLGTSRPISRILSRPKSRAIIHLGLPLPTASCDLPANIERAARSHRPCGPLGLAPGGVYQAVMVTHGAGGLLHHRFTLTRIAPGGLFSVALSRGLPRVGVTHRLALWSPDFPRHLRAAITQPTRPQSRLRASGPLGPLTDAPAPLGCEDQPCPIAVSPRLVRRVPRMASPPRSARRAGGPWSGARRGRRTGIQ